MVVHILAFATYMHIVPRLSFRPASNLTVCSTFVVKSALPIEVTFMSPVAIQWVDRALKHSMCQPFDS